MPKKSSIHVDKIAEKRIISALTSNPEHMEPKTLMELLWYLKGKTSLSLNTDNVELLEKIIEKAQELTDFADNVS